MGFGEALAAVAGALTGLLFVALSVKSDVLAVSRSLSSRAAETLILFMTPVLIAVFLVAPQPAAAMGAELLAVAVVPTQRESASSQRQLVEAAGSRAGPGARDMLVPWGR